MRTSYGNRTIVATAMLLAAALLWCAKAPNAPASAQDDNDQVRDEKVKKEDFTDEDLKVEKVSGKWKFGTLLDVKQSQDYSVPVIVAAIKTVYGQGKYLGRVKLVEAKIQNRSQKVLEAVKLRWSIADNEDPNTILLEGVMPSFAVRIEPFSEPVLTDIPPVYFNKLVKPLLKNGELNVHILLMVSVQEASFADGTVWQSPPQSASVKTLFQKASFGSGPRDERSRPFKPVLFWDLPYWRTPRPQPAESTCEEQPRSSASAVLLTAFQSPDPGCRNNRHCDYDAANNKNFCNATAGEGIYCDLGDCDSEGHCNCWQALGPCTTCPDDDGDGRTSAACGGTDCNDNDEFVRPGLGELCGDTKDNDCDGKVDCDDETCQNDCADNDEDGYSPVEGDCDDFDGSVHPGPENCNDAIDNNCNRTVNEGCETPPECIPPCAGLMVCFNGICGYTPILIDVAGDGFALTGRARGVLFDLNSDGQKDKLAWTVADSDDAWLALDRNANDVIDTGRELFGNFTAQPDPPPGRERNGFIALSEFDKRAHGGNGDDVIDSKDAVFPKLRLWQDVNHNGVSEPAELYTLPALDVVRLHLDYKESRRTDRHGNQFRYRAKVRDAKGAKVNRWAWDVYLVSAP